MRTHWCWTCAAISAASIAMLADALGTKPSLVTLDLFAGTRAGTVQLAKKHIDPSCGHVITHAPLAVLTDAGTRSAGEFMASWLWASGATVVGERTVGALIDMLAQDDFAPSRSRPFAIQSVGLRPDVALDTTLADLRDGGPR